MVLSGRTPWPLADRALQDISSQQSSRNWGSWSCWRRDTSTTGRGQSNPDLRDDPEVVAPRSRSGVMVGSFTKTNAFIARRFKTPLGQRETSWDILSQKTSSVAHPRIAK